MELKIKPNAKFDTFKNIRSKKYFLVKQSSELNLIDTKFYQKLFVVLISLFTFLILPESPKELENVCNTYFSRQSCDVW